MNKRTIIAILLASAMYLIDRDGTILSTSTDAEELEPLIKKALNIEYNNE